MKVIGNKEVFAFEISAKTSHQLRKINIYVANRNICIRDNTVYLPQFVNAVFRTAEFLKHKFDYYADEDFFWGKSLEEAHKIIRQLEQIDDVEIKLDFYKFWFNLFDWGVTTESVHNYIFPINGKLYLTVEFWREDHLPISEIGKVFGVEIIPYEIIRTCELAVQYLDKDKRYLNK